MSGLPLSGVRVLEVGGHFAGSLAAMFLADQGAEVVCVLSPSGSVSNAAVGAVLDRGKTRVEIDFSQPAELGTFFGLLGGVDILIHTLHVPLSTAIRLSDTQLVQRWPDLIAVSLPGSGEGDPILAGVALPEGIVAAATAQYTNIHAARELFGLDPVYTGLPLASVYAAAHASTAAILALRRRNAGGGGTVIQAPLTNAALSAMSSLHMVVEDQPERYSAPRLPATVKSAVLPLLRAWARSGGPGAQGKLLAVARKSYPALMSSYRCADGRWLYVFAIDNAKLAKALLAQLGLLDEFLAEGLVCEDPYGAGDRRDNLAEASNLFRSWQARLKAAIAERVAARSSTEWETALSAAGVPCSVQRTTAEWLNLPELRAAGILVEIDDPELGPMVQPGLQTWLSDSPVSGVHPHARRRVSGSAVTWSSASLEKPRTDRTAGLPTPKAPGAWLRGLTVIDMSSMVAGPVAGRTLAEYGARVIKIETPTPNHGPRLTCWYGLDGNKGKESLLLDLKSPQGREVMLRLIERSDVLLTNHTAEAMDALGLSVDEVERANSRLIYCRVGAYNGPRGGPWAGRHGYDPVLQAASGIMTRYGDPDFPELHAIASCVDALTGYSAAFGMALALYRRDQDGAGRCVDASLAAAATLVQLPFAFSYKGRLGTSLRDNWRRARARFTGSIALGMDGCF